MELLDELMLGVIKTWRKNCIKVNNNLPLLMKCSEAYRILQKDGWYPVSQT